ncbi:MAG: (2Fe-2S)-binding protein [Verrucomicrobia bacterium]|nr:MAG: (2Fe-2S)-binding protein [Verrucomicrobiota bacterium]
MSSVTPIKSAPSFRKTTDTFVAGAKTLPQRYFISPEVFAQELAKIFSRQWILVGHQSQIARPGDYFVSEVSGESLIVVRDKRGEIHGFYNVCRHRGSRLIENRNGQLSAAIQCPYHAWTYAFDGRLIGAPHMDDVPGFNKTEYSLHPVNVGLWEGFIFVNLADASAQRGGYISLNEWFVPLTGKFSRWNLPALRPAKRIEYDVRANWKLIFQNYSECYHCPGVHPELSKISPYDSSENDLTEGPFLGGLMRIASDKSLTMSGRTCALPVGDFGNEDFRFVFYYSIFPNMLLSLHPDYVMVHQLQPQSPERTLILCDWFFHPEAFERQDFRPEDAIEFWDMVNRQDWHVCELSQQGIASRTYQPGPYSSRESIPAAWDRYYHWRLDS